MIRQLADSLQKRIAYRCSTTKFKPHIYSNSKSVVSLSQWWTGGTKRPLDYYVQDTLDAQIIENWSVGKEGIFRVVYEVCISDHSMDININKLKKSMTLNQLIQLSANQKQKLVDNPSTVIIKPIFEHKVKQQSEGRITKNILQIDKLFQEGVGLKTSYLINYDSLQQQEYLKAISKRYKAVSSDVALGGKQLADMVFEHGYRLEHVFYSSPFFKDVPRPDIEQVLSAMLAVDYKGKLVIGYGEECEEELQIFRQAAKKMGFTSKLQFALKTDGWYTMI